MAWFGQNWFGLLLLPENYLTSFVHLQWQDMKLLMHILKRLSMLSHIRKVVNEAWA